MNKQNKKVYEMLGSVLTFRSNHPELILESSPIEQLFKEVEAAFNTMKEASSQQLTGKNGLKSSVSARNNARDGLLELLEAISRTASSMGVHSSFMPRDRNARAVLEAAGVFVDQAEPLKARFVENHLPLDFIESLRAGMITIEGLIGRQGQSRDARTTATRAIAAAQTQALSVLGRLDPLVENLLHNNEPAKAAWFVTPHIAKPTRRKKVDSAAASPPVPPASPPVAA